MYSMPLSPERVTGFLALRSLQTPFNPLPASFEKYENVRIFEKKLPIFSIRGFIPQMLGTA